MGSLRAKKTVLWESFNGVGQDDYNEDIESWADPVPVKVFGAKFLTASEKIEIGYNRLEVDCVLLIPPSLTAGERDRFTVDGRKYEVIGVPATAKNNPLSSWNPGGHLYLRSYNG